MRKPGRRVCGARMVNIDSPVQLYCPNRPLPGQKRCWRHNRGHPYPPDTMARFAAAARARTKAQWQDPEWRARNLAARNTAAYRASHGHYDRARKGKPKPEIDKDHAAAMAKLEKLMAENALIVANQPAKWEDQNQSQQLTTLTGMSLSAMHDILAYKVSPASALKDPAKMKLLQMRRDTAYGIITAQIRIGYADLKRQELDQSQQFVDALDQTRAAMAKDSSTRS